MEGDPALGGALQGEGGGDFTDGRDAAGGGARALEAIKEVGVAVRKRGDEKGERDGEGDRQDGDRGRQPTLLARQGGDRLNVRRCGHADYPLGGSPGEPTFR